MRFHVRVQMLEVVHGSTLQRATAWDAGGAAANFAAAVPPLLASMALSGGVVSQVRSCQRTQHIVRSNEKTTCPAHLAAAVMPHAAARQPHAGCSQASPALAAPRPWMLVQPRAQNCDPSHLHVAADLSIFATGPGGGAGRSSAGDDGSSGRYDRPDQGAPLPALMPSYGELLQ